jgi:hypothetical protein
MRRTARLFCIVAMMLLSLAPAAAQRGAADLDGIKNEIDAICAATWQDANLRSRLCESDDVYERMRNALHQMKHGYANTDLEPAPSIVRGAGIMNEFVYVAFQLNGICRGSSAPDDVDKLDAICAIRDRLGTVLSKRGYCYGMKGQTGGDMKWHRCTARSLR